MTAKEYLNRIRVSNLKINVKEEELYRLRLNMLSLSPQVQGDRIKTSGTNDIMRTVDKIVDLQVEINAEIDMLVDLKRDIRNKINNLSDDRYITVLTDYYINCKTWEQVAEDNNFSLRSVYYIHGYALKAFQKIM